MFKSIVIENYNYFKYKKIVFILMFISSAFMGLSTQLRLFSLIWWVLIIAALILTHYYQAKFQSLINRLSSNRKIEIDTNEIRIISKDNKVESFHLGKIDKVIVKDDYNMRTNEKVRVYNEFTGMISDNFIFIKNNSKLYRFEFVMPSHFMKEELKKMIESWKTKGYNVVTVDVGFAENKPPNLTKYTEFI